VPFLPYALLLTRVHLYQVVCTEYEGIARKPTGRADLYNQQDLYIFSGKEKFGDLYAPTFVYHGFRYIRLDFSSASGDDGSDDGSDSEIGDSPPEVHGLWMHSDVDRHGSISFRDDASPISEDGQVLDAIHRMVVQTQRDNLYSLPTDCPQREKRGN
jgi:alpha-L-rhamnosidase